MNICIDVEGSGGGILSSLRKMHRNDSAERFSSMSETLHAESPNEVINFDFLYVGRGNEDYQ